MVCLGDVFDVLKVFDLFLEVVLFVFVFLLAAPCILYLFRWSKDIYCIKPVVFHVFIVSVVWILHTDRVHKFIQSQLVSV